MEKLIYTRREAAFELGRSESTVDVMIRRGLLKITRQGRRISIDAASLRRAAAQPLTRIWPPRQNGKTTRHFAPQPPAGPRSERSRGGQGEAHADGKKKPPARPRLEPGIERSIA